MNELNEVDQASFDFKVEKSMAAIERTGIPRKSWADEMDPWPGDPLSQTNAKDFISRLSEEFGKGANLVFTDGSWQNRLRVAGWFGVQALQHPNWFYRSEWDSSKPAEPKSQPIPFTVRYDDVDGITTLFMGEDDQAWNNHALRPDIFILTELGSEFINRGNVAAVDALLKHRVADDLMTVVTLARPITGDTDYYPATREILKSNYVRAISLGRIV